MTAPTAALAQLESEFLDALQQIADTKYSGKLHQAFVDWFIRAEFGPRVEWHFTDDAGDGGIDALVWRPEESPSVVVLQSKFTQKLGRHPLGKWAYQRFQQVIDAFRDGSDTFNSFLEGVRDDARVYYRRAHARLNDGVTWHRGKKAFRLITTCRALRRAESSDIPASSFVYVDEILSLYQRYRKGETPRARDLELDVVDKLTYVDRKRRVKSFLFNAKLSDFRRYLEHNDVARLVARNIRYNLSGRVGRVVRRTYENEPHDFWYLHNGLTMICDEYRESGRHTIIVNPSVVNGAQTLYAIAGSRATRSNALVTTRVVVRRSVAGPVEDDAWLQKVIRGVNTQNRVKAYDFRSNEPEQFELQALFREVKVLFERKRGEWKEHRNDPAFRGFDRLPLFRLGQVLCCSAFTDGKGVLRMKSGLEEVFSNDRQYRALFPPRAQIRRRFPRIYLAYRAYRLLAAYGYGTAKELRRRRHGFWNAFWLFHRGLGAAFKNGSPSVEQIRRMFDAFHGSGRPAQSARKVCRRVTKAVWAAWRIGQKKDRERWTPNNFFKVQYGTAILQRHAFPKVRADIMRLGQMIAAA